ncbi:hypothetical protein [Clostridium sp.]
MRVLWKFKKIRTTCLQSCEIQDGVDAMQKKMVRPFKEALDDIQKVL